jgi:hypothetical protein
MKKLINEFRMLDSEEQAFFGYGALVLLGAMFLFWLTTTVTPPVADHHTTDYQTYQKATKIVGLFNRQQMEHFWTNFNYDLYNRICEIKYSEL